jgi:hypothetical protein
VTALGLLLQVPPVHRAVERGMAWLGARFPFSRLLHGLELELMGIAKSPVKSVLAKIGDHQVLGFLMEELVDGRCVVFAPGSPNPSKGTVYIVAPESVQRIDASRVQVVSCISNWGAGVGKVVGPP